MSQHDQHAAVPVDAKTAALHEQLIAQLEAAGNKVLRPFTPKEDYTPVGASAEGERKVLMVLDFEATGKEPAKDLPIEIGFVRLEYDPATGAMGRVLERYSGLEDPGFELNPEVERITGLKREMLIGHRFDDAHINQAIASSDFIIAHNASYDRTLGERRFPALIDKPWGCTMAEGPWEAMNIGSKGQEFLAFKVASIHYGAHRAQADCEALVQIMATPAHDGRQCLAHVLDNARKPTFTVWAERSPFEKKDTLRNDGGYRWNGEDPGKIPKTWYKDRVTDLSEAFSFLQENVYGYPAFVTVDTMTAMERYSNRHQAREKMKTDSAPSLEAGSSPAASQQPVHDPLPSGHEGGGQTSTKFKFRR
jgi:DNA polymerase III subunit epsilon